MQSRTIHLTSVAPLVVAALALSISLANPARADETMNAAIEPQLIVSSPIDAVAGSLPASLFAPSQESQPANSADSPEPPMSVYTPAHLEVSHATPIAPIAPEAAPEPKEAEASVYSPAHRELAALPAADDNAETKDLQATVSETNQSLADATPDTSVIELRGTQTPTSDTEGDAPLRQQDIAQTVPTDTVNPDQREYDLTPVSLPRRTPQFNRLEGMKYNALYALPGRLFFSTIVDNSLRLETNVFQTENATRQDMIYRILPNTTLGWALTRKTRVSANYFFLRDQYTHYNNPLSRNFHSVGMQLDQDLWVSGRNTLTTSFMARSLFSDPDRFNSQYFCDLLPSITYTRQVGYSTVLYASVLGQLRFREVLSQWQEGDQFYSMGGVYRKGPYQVLADFTLNSNFGNDNLRQGQDNQVFILTQEFARKIPVIKLPMDMYVRCQEIWNVGADSSPGYAGFNFRVFGGARLYINKPVIFPVKLASN